MVRPTVHTNNLLNFNIKPFNELIDYLFIEKYLKMRQNLIVVQKYWTPEYEFPYR